MLDGERTERWWPRVIREEMPLEAFKDLKELEEENQRLWRVLREKVEKEKRRPFFILTFILAHVWMVPWAFEWKAWLGLPLIFVGWTAAAVSLAHALNLKVDDQEVKEKVYGPDPFSRIEDLPSLVNLRKRER